MALTRRRATWIYEMYEQTNVCEMTKLCEIKANINQLVVNGDLFIRRLRPIWKVYI